MEVIQIGFQVEEAAKKALSGFTHRRRMIKEASHNFAPFELTLGLAKCFLFVLCFGDYHLQVERETRVHCVSRSN